MLSPTGSRRSPDRLLRLDEHAVPAFMRLDTEVQIGRGKCFRDAVASTHGRHLEPAGLIRRDGNPFRRSCRQAGRPCLRFSSGCWPGIRDNARNFQPHPRRPARRRRRFPRAATGPRIPRRHERQREVAGFRTGSGTSPIQTMGLLPIYQNCVHVHLHLRIGKAAALIAAWAHPRFVTYGLGNAGAPRGKFGLSRSLNSS